MRTLISRVTLVAVVAAVAIAQDPGGWTQLSLSTCNVDAFLRQNPQSNGQGVVIAVLDTGVDPSIPGLTKTPDGAVKVVDVQDFTGQGDVELKWIRLDAETEALIDYAEEGAPISYEPPEVGAAPAGETRRWWFGMLDEGKFVNSDQPDINGNGATDDEFPVLVTALSGDGSRQAVAYVDTDLDRSFADEKPLKNYRQRYDTFTFPREKPEEQIVPLTFAVNIFLRQQKIVFHFDDGAHGTHVAGIAAGYQINNQVDFHGVAPGAKLMSLKIGQNAIGGVSTTESMKRAFEYAANYAREQGVPVVMNMSYGVESEIEGHSDIDKFVDELLRENPYLVFCTSAGNSGPGLSTVGTPSAATEAICVAALMAADTARDVAGWTMDHAVLTLFSSRGGELDKPDVATPGWSTSTVPRWVRRGDFWAGTSMASPYAAGCCALLISHVLQQDPDADVPARDVRRALSLSGRPVPGFTELDYGYGIPDLVKAGRMIKELRTDLAEDPVISYEISTLSPMGHRASGRTAYWRSTWFPSEDRQTFTITPVFAPLADMNLRTQFTRKYELRANDPWLSVEQESVYLRGEQPARVYVSYDAEQITEPGLHVGTVDALYEGRVAFRLINTVIIPFTVSADANFERRFEGNTANGWDVTRYFIAVPPGASSMRLVLTAPEGQKSKAHFDRVYDPYGGQFRSRGKQLDTEGGRHEIEWTFTEELMPGVWEVCVAADQPHKQWPYDLRVRFFGLHADPPIVTTGGQKRPSGDITVTNMFTEPLPASLEGQIEGFRMAKEDQFEGLDDVLEYSVSMDDRCNRLRLTLEMSREHYARTTDIGVQVLDGDGESVYQSAFDGRLFDATFSTRGKSKLTVKITGGFAVADDQRKTDISVKIDQLFITPVAVSLNYGGTATVDFVPGVPMKLSFSAGEALDNMPAGYHPVGFLRARERGTNEEALHVLMDVDD